MAKLESKNKYVLKAKIGKQPLKEYDVDIFDIETKDGKTLGGILYQQATNIEILKGRIESLETENANIKAWAKQVAELLNLKFAESEDL